MGAAVVAAVVVGVCCCFLPLAGLRDYVVRWCRGCGRSCHVVIFGVERTPDGFESSGADADSDDDDDDEEMRHASGVAVRGAEWGGGSGGSCTGSGGGTRRFSRRRSSGGSACIAGRRSSFSLTSPAASEVAAMQEELREVVAEAEEKRRAVEAAEAKRTTLLAEAAHVADEAAGVIEAALQESAKWVDEARLRAPELLTHVEFMAKTMAACGKEALEPNATAAQRCRASEMAAVCREAMVTYSEAKARRAKHRADDLAATLAAAKAHHRETLSVVRHGEERSRELGAAYADAEATRQVLADAETAIRRVLATGALSRSPVERRRRHAPASASHEQRNAQERDRRRRRPAPPPSRHWKVSDSSGGSSAMPPHAQRVASLASPRKLRDEDFGAATAARHHRRNPPSASPPHQAPPRRPPHGRTPSSTRGEHTTSSPSRVTERGPRARRHKTAVV